MMRKFSDAERIERRKAANLKWRAANPESHRAQGRRDYQKNKAARIARAIAYKAKTPGLQAFYLARSRAKRFGCEPAWLTDADQKRMLSWYELAAAIDYEIDHIVPIDSPVVCGLHVPWNLQTLPSAENIAKKNRICGRRYPENWGATWG